MLSSATAWQYDTSKSLRAAAVEVAVLAAAVGEAVIPEALSKGSAA